MKHLSLALLSCALAVLAVMVLYFGLYPKPLTDVMEVSVQHLLSCGLQSKIAVVGVCQ